MANGEKKNARRATIFNDIGFLLCLLSKWNLDVMLTRGQLPYQKYEYFANSPQDIILALGNSRHFISLYRCKCASRVNCILKNLDAILFMRHSIVALPSKFVMINELRKFQMQTKRHHKISIHISSRCVFSFFAFFHLLFSYNVNNAIGNMEHYQLNCCC